MPVSPEAVARFLFDATGAKVREVPIAARVSGVYSPYDPRWIVVLDRTVELLAPHDSSVVITDTVHVAWACPSLIPCADGLPFSHMHMFVPAVNPPAVEEIPVPQYDGPGRSVGIVWMSFPIKATMPTILVPVVPRPE